MPGRGSEITQDGAPPLPLGPLRFGSALSAADRLMPLGKAVKLFALLFFEGASVAMALWGSGSEALVHYAVDNQAAKEERSSLLLYMLVGGALAALGGFAFLSRAKHEPVKRLERFGWQLSPLLLVGLLPVLFTWQIWAARELTFGVLVCIVGFLFYVCLSHSLAAGWAWSSAQRASARVRQKLDSFGPPLIVFLAAGFYTAYFAYYTVLFHRSVLTMAYDLGLENNLMYNLVNGGKFMHSSPLSGPHGSHFGFHATLFAYVIGLFYMLKPEPETLLVFQAAMIGFAAVPLYLWSRARIGRWAAALLAVLYVFYPPVHGSNLYDFHYLPLGVFFLWLTLWLIDSGHYKWGALAVILTLSVREDVSADLVIMGAFMILAGRRPRAGFVVTVVAAVYFLIIKMVVMPRFLAGSESFIHQWQGLIPPGGRGYAGVLQTVLGNPVYTLTSLLEPDKFLYLVQIGAPFCFVVWRKPIGFFVSLPGFFFTLLSTKYPPLVQISFQYTAHWTAFLFVAFVVTLEWLRQPRFAGDDLGRRRQRIWLAVATFTTLLTSYQYGAILQQNTAKGGFGKYKFAYSDTDRKRYESLKKLIAMVPPAAKITSAEYVVPHVSSRIYAYTLRNGLYDADYLIWEAPARDDERTFVREALKGSFGVVASAGDFVLAKRGHDKSENQSWLKKSR
jgi:uncharacterized membrane protein